MRRRCNRESLGRRIGVTSLKAKRCKSFDNPSLSLRNGGGCAKSLTRLTFRFDNCAILNRNRKRLAFRGIISEWSRAALSEV